MKISLASDHAGVEFKHKIKELLIGWGHDVTDEGPESADRVDYPDFAAKVSRKVSEGQVDRGILICGTGIGMALTANKFKGVRAASIVDLFSAEMARGHNDLNVLCLGARVIDLKLAEKITKIFLETPFEGGRHETRVSKIESVSQS